MCICNILVLLRLITKQKNYTKGNEITIRILENREKTLVGEELVVNIKLKHRIQQLFRSTQNYNYQFITMLLGYEKTPSIQIDYF